MKRSLSVFLSLALLFSVLFPTYSHAIQILKGTNINAHNLIQGAHVEITYYDINNKEKTERGWIHSINKTSFTIRNGFLRKTIDYNKISTVIMDEKVDEMNRLTRNIKPSTELAIKRLKRNAVTIMSRGQFDHSKIIKGWHAHVVYTSKGANLTATGRIVDKDVKRAIIKAGLKTLKIAYDDIDTLIVAEHLQDIKRYKETGAQYDAKIRFRAPSVFNKRVVGKVVTMIRDTLFFQSGGSALYQVPLSAISEFEVSIKQGSNTGKGMAIGAGIGLTLFTGTYITARAQDWGLAAWPAIVGVGIFISLPIFILSTFIGAGIESNTWVKVTPQRLNLNFAPTPSKGLGAKLSFNF